jgi:hypothetical protein
LLWWQAVVGIMGTKLRNALRMNSSLARNSQLLKS